MLNVPDFMLNSLMKLDPNNLFKRAKLYEQLNFNQFAEWIEKEIQKQLYRRDSQFFELEQEQIEQEKMKEQQRLAEIQKAMEYEENIQKQKQFRIDFKIDQQQALDQINIQKKKQ